MELSELLRQWEGWAIDERIAARIAGSKGDHVSRLESSARADTIELCAAAIRETYRAPCEPHRN